MLVIERLICRKDISTKYRIRPRRSRALPDAGLFRFAHFNARYLQCRESSLVQHAWALAAVTLSKALIVCRISYSSDWHR